MSLENILFWPKLPGVLSSKTATKSPDVVLKIFVLKDGSKKSRHLVINIRLVAEKTAAEVLMFGFVVPKMKEEYPSVVFEISGSVAAQTPDVLPETICVYRLSRKSRCLMESLQKLETDSVTVAVCTNT